MAEFIASKDMLHRIETYAGHAHAFVSLDGGIGSVQEVLVIAELLARRHPVVMYRTAAGTLIPKPLWVLNESGIYTSVLRYLEERRLLDVRAHICSAASLEELGNALQAHFAEHLPVPAGSSRGKFRDQYGDAASPMMKALID